MRIVLATRLRAEVDDVFELLDDESGVDPDYVVWRPSEADQRALEAAVRLKRDLDARLTAVCVGPVDMEAALYYCLARGADDAARIWDDDLPDVQPFLVAHAIAAYLSSQPADVVLFGPGVIGAATAGFASLPYVADATNLAASEGARCLVTRNPPGRLSETLSVPLPAVVSVDTESLVAELPSLSALELARTHPLERLSFGDVGVARDSLEEAQGCVTLSLRRAEPTQPPVHLAGTSDEIARQIREIVDGQLQT